MTNEDPYPGAARGKNDMIGAFNLTAISGVRAALDLLDLKPSKALGQNFLIDANILAIILNAAALDPADKVLEIGAGLGVLTEALAKIAGHVAAIEKDRRLCDFLKARFQDFPNVELISGDALKLDLEKFWRSGVNKMAANLPYSVGSVILADIFKGAEKPERIVVTLQNEVACRLVAEPDTSDYGLLSIWRRLDYDGDIRKKISASCFYPNPEVQSAVVCLTRRAGKISPRDRDYFFGLTKYAFSQRRKQLQKILSRAPAEFNCPADILRNLLVEMRLNPCARPEELSLEQWVMLSDRVAERIQRNPSAI